MWSKVVIDEDPYWKEWHRCLYKSGDQFILKVWESLSGYWEASLTSRKGGRSIKQLDARNDQEAKKEANIWAARQLFHKP